MSAWNADEVRLKVAQDLREIVRLYGLLGDEAEHRALGHDAADLDALNLAGPAANLEAWEHRYEAAEAELTARTDYAADQVAELHPLLVLATWADCLRDERGHATDLRATVPREADYIAGSIEWCLSEDENGDMNFIAVDEIARDLRKCRAMLENVLKEGNRADRGVPCMGCGVPLVKVWGKSVEDDSWRCYPCDLTSTHEQYILAVRADFLRNADALTATDMLEAYRIAPGSLTGWASTGKVRKRGKDESGRTLYDVAMAVELRDARESA